MSSASQNSLFVQHCRHCRKESHRFVDGMCPACAAQDAAEYIIHGQDPQPGTLEELIVAIERKPLWWRHMREKDQNKVQDWLLRSTMREVTR